MLTSTNPSNQYLRPEYLSPLPATLDAKNSPLALLAQTCSSIGADSTPNPKLLANIEKSTKTSSSNHVGSGVSRTNGHTTESDKLSPGMSSHSSLSNSSSNDIPKSSFKPYELTVSSKDTSEDLSQRSSSVGLKASHKHTRTDSNQSANSQRTSPKHSSPNHLSNGNTTTNHTSPPPRASSKDSAFSQDTGSTNLTHSSLSKSSTTSSSSLDLKDGLSYQQPSLNHSMQQSPFMNGSGIPSSAALAFLNGGYSPYSMDFMAAMSNPHHPHHHQQMLKAAAMNPYFNNYALSRLKVPGLMESHPHHPLMPFCRDPYCTGCALSNHQRGMMGKAGSTPGACPIGCTQCDHVGGLSNGTSVTSIPSSTGTITSSSKPGSVYSSPAAAAYAHAQLSALAAASQLPFLCNWIGTDASYCGKRFGTSDELLQHLRTHTSNMSESVLTTAAATGLPPNHPLLQRTYPTPPLSPLSTARYHPYSKPSSLLPPTLQHPGHSGSSMHPLAAGLPPGLAPHPSLAQYFSPFSFYGIPRLGTPPSMHP